VEANMKNIYPLVLFACISGCALPNFAASPAAVTPAGNTAPSARVDGNKTTVDFTTFVALLKAPTPDAWAHVLHGNSFELHRLFSSGNLNGSRGKETHQNSSLNEISKEGEVLVQKQTSYSLTYSFNFLKATGIDHVNSKT
jgi:hypothetical protein